MQITRIDHFVLTVASIEATGARKVRITFNEADRELALLAGMRPILQKAQWEGRDIAEGVEVFEQRALKKVAFVWN